MKNRHFHNLLIFLVFVFIVSILPAQFKYERPGMIDFLKNIPSGISEYTKQSFRSENMWNLSAMTLGTGLLVIYDDELLDVFWRCHDATTLNRQGPDIGTQYRSAIYYNDSTQEAAAKQSKEKNSTLFSSPIVTEITAASKYYLAEDYHQKYLEKRGMGSCH